MSSPALADAGVLAGRATVPSASALRREERGADWPRVLAVHSLGWLVLANAVGMWMATLLLAPRLGDLAGPWTWGRWAMLHLDLQLYGWCATPVLGLLLRAYGVEDGIGRGILGLWSGALATGAASWLAGRSSGKLFLDWTGAARFVLVAALLAMVALLVASWWRRRGDGTVLARVGRGFGLIALLGVPAALWSATGAGYPAIDPGTGGPTGTSLLASSLGLVCLLFAFPRAMGLERRRVPAGGGALSDRALRHLGLGLLGFQLAFVALAGFSDHAHGQATQWFGLATTVLWWPLVLLDLTRFVWSRVGRVWLRAGAAWGFLLAASGVVAFLPGVLDRWKFTQVLVAHSHVAMAGLLTCLCVLLLDGLQGDPRKQGSRVFDSRPAFVAWHAGCVALVAALAVLGGAESVDPFLVPRGGPFVDALYAGRWVGGLSMTAASVVWWQRALAYEEVS